MNISNTERALLLACVLVLILFFGGLLIFFRQQGDTKTTSTPAPRTFGALHLTPTPTLSALFFDNFSDNSQNWDVGSEARYGSAINNGMLTMMEANHKPFREPVPSNIAYDDFSVAVTMTLLTGDQNDSVGLYLRANGTTGQGYYIDIYGDNTYDIAKISVDAAQKIHASYLAEPQHTSVLHPEGQKNTVMVIMKGVSIVLLINNTVVKSVRDSEFSSGKIMLFVENGNSSNGVTASFDSIAVYTAPEHLPS
ncbi:MAG: hypothetical protein NVS4B12_06940 [Ktedonobacteraceae bacterium]